MASPVVTKSQPTFTGGVLSPRLFTRVDIEQYFTAMSVVDNAIVWPHGGLARAGGTRYVTEVKDSSKDTVLIPFEFNDEQAYVFEVGEGYIRFIKDNGVLLDDKTITNGDFTTNITGWTDISAGTGSIAFNTDHMDLVSTGAGNEARAEQTLVLGTNTYTITCTTGATLNYRVGTTSNSSNITSGTVNGAADTFTLTPTAQGTIYITFENANSSTVTLDAVSINTPAYQIENPWVQADLQNIKHEQSADVMYLAIGTKHPKTIKRTDVNSHASFVIEDYVFFDGPYLPEKSVITVTPSATTGTGITLTASAALFNANMVGAHIRLSHGSTKPIWGYATITAYTSTTVVTADVIRDFNATTASLAYREGAWSIHRGFPAAVGFHEERLWWASTSTEPQTLWGTKSGSELFQDFDPLDEADEAVADSGITVTINDGQVNKILWLESDKNGLVIGTRSGEFVLAASETATTSFITPDNKKISRTTSEGCSAVQGDFVGNTLVFVQKSGRKLMEFGYDLESDATIATDLTLLSESITKGATEALSGIVEMAFQREPDRVMWCVRADGKLLGFTYNKGQKINAWHTHTMAGTAAKVKSIAVIPSPTGGRDELWMITERTINSVTKKYIEYMEHYEIPVQADWFFVHSGLTYDGAATTTISGLDHLEGETLELLTDGATHPDVTVSSGSVTLNAAYSKVQIGLGYDTTIISMPIEIQLQDGTSVGKFKRISRVYISVLDSLGMKIGRDLTALEIVPFRDGNDPMGSAPDAFTGILEVVFPGTYEERGFVIIKQEQPLPLNVLSFHAALVIADK